MLHQSGGQFEPRKCFVCQYSWPNVELNHLCGGSDLGFPGHGKFPSERAMLFCQMSSEKQIFVWQRVHCKLYCLGLANRIKKDVDSLPSPHGLSDQTMIDWPQASSTRSAQTVTWPRVRPRRTPSTAVQAWEQVCPTLVLSQHNTDRVLVLVVLCLSSLN